MQFCPGRPPVSCLLTYTSAVPDQRRISAFFPCFNDAGTIASMVMEALVVLRELAVEYEVIVIENGSTDYAWDVLDELERLYGDWGVDNLDRGRVRIIRFAEALDYGGALRAGFAACRYELIFYTDGDGQYDVRELRSLYQALLKRRGGRSAGRRRDGEQDHPPRSDPSPLHQLGLPQPDAARLPVQGPRRRLRLPADQAPRLRHHRADPEQRHHRAGADDQDPVRRLPDRRGARRPLPPGVRRLPVLPAAPPDRRLHQPGEALVVAARARRARHALAAAGAAAGRRPRPTLNDRPV